MPEREPFPHDAERDDAPLDALRDAWRALRAPEATPEGEEVDPETRAAVEWLQDAWLAVEPPPVALPARLVWSARLRGARRNAPILAAAAALVAFALFVWRAGAEPTTPGEAERLAQAAPTGEAPGAKAPEGSGSTAGREAGAPGDGAAGDEIRAAEGGARRSPAPTVVAAAPEPNAIVLEHGSVRLVLLGADEVTTTIEHEPELNPAGRREAPAPPEEGTR